MVKVTKIAVIIVILNKKREENKGKQAPRKELAKMELRERNIQSKTRVRSNNPNRREYKNITGTEEKNID